MGLIKRLLGRKINTVSLAEAKKETDYAKRYQRKITHSKRKNLIQKTEIQKQKNEAKIRFFDNQKYIGKLTIGITKIFLTKHKLPKGVVISGALVEKKYRGEGIFKQMLAEAEHLAKKEFKTNTIYIVPQDKKALAIYTKLGYTPIEINGKITKSNWKQMPVMKKEV
jgi:GNAT superfamily N-acetyltransferase